MDWDAFFTLHRGLDREGPGETAEVVWAMRSGAVAPDASVVDLGCGPGADLEPLASVVPNGMVLGIEKHDGFAEEARARIRSPRITVETGDMADITEHPSAPFDAIWSAGALYFMGLEAGPRAMAKALRPGGVLAFSEPCFFTDAPSKSAWAFWEGYPAQTASGIARAVSAAGFDVIAQRPVSDAGWERYYEAIDARIAALRPEADRALADMLDLCAAEATAWRKVRSETGYLITVARLSA